MPYARPHLCNHPGCGELTSARLCGTHERQLKREYGRIRRISSGPVLHSSYAWQKASRQFLRANPICRECLKSDRISVSAVTDHIVPHRGDLTLFWDRSNWQPLCKRCHDRKTALHDGRWGQHKRLLG